MDITREEREDLERWYRMQDYSVEMFDLLKSLLAVYQNGDAQDLANYMDEHVSKEIKTLINIIEGIN